MRRNLGNLAVAAVLSAALLFGACGDSANSVTGVDADAFPVLETPVRDGGGSNIDDRQAPRKIPVDENGRPL